MSSPKQRAMARLQHAGLGLVLLLSGLSASGQSDSAEIPDLEAQQAGDSQSSNSGAVPAFGQENTGALSADNPPISGLDQPSLEPRAASRSYLIPGAHVSQSLDSNLGGTGGNGSIHGVTRALGSIALQKLWSRYDVSLDYIGGGAFYSNRATRASQMHSLRADQRLPWRTGQLVIRDSFNYLPEGQFGFGSFGGFGGLGVVRTAVSSAALPAFSDRRNLPLSSSNRG